MKTLSISESIEWCSSRFVQVSLGERPKYLGTTVGTARFKCPSQVSRQYWFCSAVERAMDDWDFCLLLVVEWGAWPSSENWHLYYRLRKSYGDDLLLEQAPGHLFSNDDKDDLRSFLQVCVGMGWSVLLLPQKGDRAAFVSHDEWIELASRNNEALKRTTADFSAGGLENIY